MMPANARNARFTDAASGKTAATSGSSVTGFSLLPYRSANRFRSPRLKSYSGRISSGSTLVARGFPVFLGLDVPFFIVNALSARSLAGADDPDRVSAFGKHNRDETGPVREANQHFSLS